MGLLGRLFKKPPPPGHAATFVDRVTATSPEAHVPVSITITLSDRASYDETLHVVGESYRQDTLWRIVGGQRTEPVRHPVIAELRPEPENQYDRNAIAVLIIGQLVGYLSRADAAAYLPGLKALIVANPHGSIELPGVIVGGGIRPDGLGRLGVFLDHNPADFGVTEGEPQYATMADVPDGYGFRTGLSEARATDLEDDRYDLSWLDGLSADVPRAIVQLRVLLESVDDPIDRHYMLAELEHRLYGCRKVFSSALVEYDEACRQHDAAMDEIHPALMAKFGRLPILDTYRQAAIRWQQAKDWEAVRWWADRGLALYGDDAAKPGVVDDLRKRVSHAEAKFEALTGPRQPHRTPPRSADVSAEPVIEVLVCEVCGSAFERVRSRGRKPKACPACSGR